MSWVCKGLLAALVLSHAAALADSSLDFSSERPGVVLDRLHPEALPAHVRTESVYGRRLGDAIDVNPRLVYPGYALDRRGALNALRLGNARREIPGVPPAGLPTQIFLPTNGPSSQLLWFYVYDCQDRAVSTSLIYSKFGWQVGLRLGWERAEWSREGHVSCVIGVGKAGSQSLSSFEKKPVKPGEWHQLALVLDGKTAALFVDGDEADRKPCGYYRDGGKPQGLRVTMAERSDRAFFKTDFYAHYDRALTPAEVAEDWRAGRPCAADESAAVARWRDLTIPGGTFGYFEVGEEIPLRDGGRLVGNYRFDRPGLFEIKHEGKCFPVGIVPSMPKTRSNVAVQDLVNLQPECTAMGFGMSYCEVSVWTVEPKRDEFDWTYLDRAADACSARGVRFIPALKKTPQASEKLRRYLPARYETIGEGAWVEVRCPAAAGRGTAADREAAMKFAKAYLEARAKNPRLLLVRGRFVDPDEGLPTWRGIVAAWCNARFPGGTVVKEEEARRFLDEMSKVVNAYDFLLNATN